MSPYNCNHSPRVEITNYAAALRSSTPIDWFHHRARVKGPRSAGFSLIPTLRGSRPLRSFHPKCGPPRLISWSRSFVTLLSLVPVYKHVRYVQAALRVWVMLTNIALIILISLQSHTESRTSDDRFRKTQLRPATSAKRAREAVERSLPIVLSLGCSETNYVHWVPLCTVAYCRVPGAGGGFR